MRELCTVTNISKDITFESAFSKIDAEKISATRRSSVLRAPLLDDKKI